MRVVVVVVTGQRRVEARLLEHAGPALGRDWHRFGYDRRHGRPVFYRFNTEQKKSKSQSTAFFPGEKKKMKKFQVS